MTIRFYAAQSATAALAPFRILPRTPKADDVVIDMPSK